MRTIRAGQIQSLFAGNIRKLLEECVIDYEKLYEIRLRTGRPVFLCYGDGEKFLRTGNGMPYRVTRQDLKETLEYISGYSLYAYEDEICQGYLSVQGGHRVGITGKVILDGEHIRGMKYISCINVRLAHQVQGCAPMPNKLPKFLDNHKICIICEGNEEYEYLNRLKNLKVWNEQYDISLVNVGGNGNIPARYQDRYQNGADELVLVFCDTEKKPHEQYEDIKRKINEFHGVNNAADEVIIFGNPCTMQIISKHWTDKNLKSPAKPVNAPLIKEYTGVENYKGRADQIHEVMEHVTAENYVDMSQRVRKLDSDDSVTGSSNFGKFIKLFESDDSGWIEAINKKIE